jgi:hypothetical protein
VLLIRRLWASAPARAQMAAVTKESHRKLTAVRWLPLGLALISVLHAHAAELVPSICASDDPECTGVLVEPTADPNYVDCIRNPADNADKCLKTVAKSESDEDFDPFAACPTTPLLGPNFNPDLVEQQVRSHILCTPHTQSHKSGTIFVYYD